MNTNFSPTVSAVRRTGLLEPRHYSIGGQTPLPHDVMGKKLLFVDYPEGGRGFEIQYEGPGQKSCLFSGQLVSNPCNSLSVPVGACRVPSNPLKARRTGLKPL